MTAQTVGRMGEELARNYLSSLGYLIKEMNYSTKLGEIDIVAQKDNKIYFCEVKTRVGDLHGKPYEAITYRKLQHMRRAAQGYLLQKNIKDSKLSLQVISIELLADYQTKRIAMYEIS